MFQITDLRPSTGYVFVVCSESADGLSEPSGMSEVTHTLNINARKVTLQQLNVARSALSATVLQLRQLTPVSSSAVKVVWQVRVRSKWRKDICSWLLFINKLTTKSLFREYILVSCSSHTLNTYQSQLCHDD